MGADERSVSVIMPAFNEEGGLRSAVERTIETFRSLDITYEIVIVNDHSSDRTAEIAETLAAAHHSVSCLHHERNQGIGAALRSWRGSSPQRLYSLDTCGQSAYRRRDSPFHFCHGPQ